MVYEISCTKPDGKTGHVFMELELEQLALVQWFKNYGYLPNDFSCSPLEVIEP